MIINDMSDHLPTLMLLKQTKLVDKSPLVYRSRKLTEEKIQSTKEKLKEIDWNGVLNNKNCNTNFDKFNEELKRAMDDIAPEVAIRISGIRGSLSHG